VQKGFEQMQSIRSQHLADQILAAYQDKSEGSLERFDQLTSQMGELSPEDREELERQLGYDFKSDTWEESC
jgi:hypothetical protein